MIRYNRIHRIEQALASLRDVRDLLVQTDHPRAANKVRKAISSTQGALRHERNRGLSEAQRGLTAVWKDKP